jgi:hypothetical protein
VVIFVVCELIIGFLSVTIFDGRIGCGEVRDEGGAVGVDFSSGEAELWVVWVEANPKFFGLRRLCGGEGSGGFSGVVGEIALLERLLLGLAFALVLALRGHVAPTQDWRVALLLLLFANQEELLLGVEETADAAARELIFLLHVATKQ